MDRKNNHYNVDQLFNLINRYLAGENIKNTSNCHQALDYLSEGIQEIKKCHDLDLVLQFEKQWLKIKIRLERAAEPAKFRIKEIEIEKIIKACKPIMTKV